MSPEGRWKTSSRPTTSSSANTYDLIANTHAPKPLYEAKRLLEKFRALLGGFPPTPELAIKFLGQFSGRKPNTRARYAYVLSAFFR